VKCRHRISGQQHGLCRWTRSGEVIPPAKLWWTRDRRRCEEITKKLAGKKKTIAALGNAILARALRRRKFLELKTEPKMALPSAGNGFLFPAKFLVISSHRRRRGVAPEFGRADDLAGLVQRHKTICCPLMRWRQLHRLGLWPV